MSIIYISIDVNTGRLPQVAVGVLVTRTGSVANYEMMTISIIYVLISIDK